MPEKSNNLQDLFLNNLRKNKTPVTMFLVKGVKLQGIITWFDNFSVLLRRDGQSQLIYKHAISTVMPAASVDLIGIAALFEQGDRKRRTGKARFAAEAPDQPGDDRHGNQAQCQNEGEGHVAVCLVDDTGSATMGPHGGLQPADDRSHGPGQGPDRRDRHGARAYEPYIVAPYAGDETRQITLHGRHRRDQGHCAGPGDQNARQHGEANRDSHQMAGAHQGQGERKAIAGRGGGPDPRANPLRFRRRSPDGSRDRRASDGGPRRGRDAQLSGRRRGRYDD